LELERNFGNLYGEADKSQGIFFAIIKFFLEIKDSYMNLLFFKISEQDYPYKDFLLKNYVSSMPNRVNKLSVLTFAKP